MVGSLFAGEKYRVDWEKLERRGEQNDKVLAQILAEQDVEEYVDAVIHVHEEFGEGVD